MLKNIDFKNGKLVFGEGEHTYQEVIDDFQNASEITIVTFNISKTKDGALLKMLSEACKRGVKSRIITNIPKRFPSYYRNEADSYARAAHSMIESYIRLLDSSKFNMHLDAYFNFSNHSKIIMTDNIIYCGSANYSDESKNNLECGFVSRDKVLIKDVNDKIMEDIIYESIPYYEYNIAESIACMRAAQRFCEMSKRKIFDAAYTYWSDYETNFEDKIIYRTNDTEISAQLISEIIEEYETYENALSVVGNVIDSCYEKYEDEFPEEAQTLETLYEKYKSDYEAMLDNMRSLFEDLDQLAHYNWTDQVMYTVNEEFGAESFDENLETYMSMAMDEANYEYSNLIEDAEPTIKDILENFDKMIDYYNDLSSSLYSLLKKNKLVDNTGY